MSDRCPYCHESLKKVILCCPKCGDIKKNGKQVIQRFRGLWGLSPLKRALRKGMPHRKCELDIKIKCNNSECNKILPDFLWESEPINLAIIGPSNAGKSHFFAVLYHQLKYEPDIDGLLVNIEEPRQHENYTNNYCDPLYVTKDADDKLIKERILERTIVDDDDDVKDMLFFINIENSDDKKKKICLVYNDIPGGFFLTEDDIYKYFSYLPNAKGIFVLIGNIVEMEERTRREIIDMVLKIKKIIREKNPFIAVVMTKRDEYEDRFNDKINDDTIPELNMPSGVGMMENMGLKTGLNITDTTRERIRRNITASKKLIVDRKDGEVSLRQLVSIIENIGSENVAYFTVSALGDTLEEVDDKNDDKKEKKKKVLKEGKVPEPSDIQLPLIWMLSKLKIVKEIYSH